MRQRPIINLESALNDLDAISDWLVDEASEEVALRHIRRITSRIDTLSIVAERGSIRPEFPGIRVVGLLTSVNVAFVVTSDSVVIHRVFYGGQNWQKALTAEQDADD